MDRKKGNFNRGFEMSLNETMNKLESLLMSVAKDLAKVNRGNKAAAQRVRVGTIKLERVAKQFRRESIAAEKSGKMKKKKNLAKKAKRSKKKKH